MQDTYLLNSINKWVNTIGGSKGPPDPLGWSCDGPFIQFVVYVDAYVDLLGICRTLIY